jgi:hypothetical protein
MVSLVNLISDVVVVYVWNNKIKEKEKQSVSPMNIHQRPTKLYAAMMFLKNVKKEDNTGF